MFLRSCIIFGGVFCNISILRFLFFITPIFTTVIYVYVIAGRCFSMEHALYYLYGDDISSGDIFGKNICISHRPILSTMVCGGLFYAIWFMVAIGARV